MKFRVGVPETGGTFPLACLDAGYPIMFSANRFARGSKPRVPRTWRNYGDVALDSAGYVAMKQWGGRFPWSREEYLDLVEQVRPNWYSSMDLCCEPAARGGRSTDWRICKTAENLLNLTWAADWRGLPRPVPVLQGWFVDDYAKSLELTQSVIGVLPRLVGLGSVCNRHWSGPDGIGEILSFLDSQLDRRVRLHLFGVKTDAIERAYRIYGSRLASTDSMAWDMRARWDQKLRPPDMRPVHWRLKYMHEFYVSHRARLVSVDSSIIADMVEGL